jgi:hypothetical protein
MPEAEVVLIIDHSSLMGEASAAYPLWFFVLAGAVTVHRERRG